MAVHGGARRWLFAFACGAVGLTAPARARAADGSMPVRVVLTSSAGCGSEADLLQAIQRRNARVRAAVGSESGVTLVLSMSARGPAFHGELQVRSGDGSASSRSVDGSTCQAVIEALSLTAALALESATFTGAASSTTAANGAPEAASSPAATAATTPPPVSPKADPAAAKNPSNAVVRAPASSPSAQATGARLAVQIGAQASFAQPVSPHLNAGGAVLGRARLERVSVVSPSLTLSVQHTRSELLQDASDSVMRVTGLTLAPCPLSLRPFERLRIDPCLVVTGAELLAVGRDLPQAASAARSWWGLGALARLSLAVTRGLAFEVEGGALLPLVERRFVTLPSGRELGRTPTVAPLANAGVSYEL